MKNFWGPLSGREKTLLIWAAAGTLLALLAIAGWAWRLRPMATVWGDVGTWFAGVVTLGGLYYAGRSLRLQTAQHQAVEAARRADEDYQRSAAELKNVEAYRTHRAAALAVKVQTTLALEQAANGYQASAVAILRNDTKSPIHDVELVMPRAAGEDEVKKQGLVDTKRTLSCRVDLTGEEQQSFKISDTRESAYVYFTDVHGNRWRRTENDIFSVLRAEVPKLQEAQRTDQ